MHISWTDIKYELPPLSYVNLGRETVIYAYYSPLLIVKTKTGMCHEAIYNASSHDDVNGIWYSPSEGKKIDDVVAYLKCYRPFEITPPVDLIKDRGVFPCSCK